MLPVRVTVAVTLSWALLLGLACGAPPAASLPEASVETSVDGGPPTPGVDAGPLSPTDAGSTPPADAGAMSPADAGAAPPADAGSTPSADAGSTPSADAGSTPPADAGLPDAGAWASPTRALCAGTYGPPVATQGVTDSAVREASGLVASPVNRDVLWTHNDSGDDPRLFALRTDGTALGRLNLTGAGRGDWEDLASGACPDRRGPCLWVEDRSSQKVYAIVEPTVASATPFGDLGTTDYWTFTIDYPNALHPDVEALLVEPDGSAFYTVEKTGSARARIFRAAPPTARTATLAMTEVGSVASPGAVAGQGGNITGGDLHPSRTRLVLRTYLGLFEYRLHPGDFPGNLDAADRVDLPVSVTLEPAGEAVAYDHQGDGLFTLSEGFLTAPGQPLYHYACQ